MSDFFDVCVIGGGPAGSSLALRLANLGRRVVLVEKAIFPRLHVGESLTGGILPLLEALGVRAAIERAEFLHAPRATVFWAGHLRHRDTHGGYQVDRGKFDVLLLEAARRAGVVVQQPDRVVDSSFDGHWVLKLKNGDTLHAHFLADAAGRSKMLSGAKSRRGAHTLAIYSYWSNVDAEGGDTLVEADTSHWYWGAPLPGGLFNATVFIDPLHVRVDRYLELIRQSKLLGGRLEHGGCGEIRACAATPFLDESPVSDCFIKAGDAALAIDALSSQGVQTAIGTALHAAIVINTLIDRPGDAQLAMDFYRRRIRDSSNFHTWSARQLYREQLAVTQTDFWKKRAGEKIDIGLAQKEALTPNERIRLAARVSFVPVATATDRYIVQSDGVEWNDKTGAFIGGASVSVLLKEIEGPILAWECVQRWSRTIPPDKALQTIQWAWTEGLIEKVP